MRRLIVLSALALAATVVAALEKAPPPTKPFFTEMVLTIGGKQVMTIRYWQEGDQIRRDYEDRLPKTFLTTKDANGKPGTYIIVNHQDRGMRINNDAKMLEGRRIEDYAEWPMWDVEWFLKSYNAKRGEDTTITFGGKSVKAAVYTYKLKAQPKETATLWLDRTTRAPLRVQWGKNQNLDLPMGKVTADKPKTYQTKVEFKKYMLGEPIRAEMFKVPSFVVDGGNGESLGAATNTNGKGPRPGFDHK